MTIGRGVREQQEQPVEWNIAKPFSFAVTADQTYDAVHTANLTKTVLNGTFDSEHLDFDGTLTVEGPALVVQQGPGRSWHAMWEQPLN